VTINTGDTVGPYEILSRLGSGGAGRVFKARHSITGRIEAIKVLLEDNSLDDAQAQRFLREVQVQARMNHPNVVQVFNALWIEHKLVMAMEYVQGSPLDESLRRSPPTLAQALDYCCQTLSALAYAHSRGVVHRDIKPANLLLTPEGVIRVADFGLAKTAENIHLTKTGTAIGSFHYASPEQIQCQDDLDERADIYSVGTVLYKLATGQKLFGATTAFELMRAHVTEKPQRPSELDTSIPVSLDDAILRSLEKNAGDRFTSAEEFRTELKTISDSLDGGVSKHARDGHRAAASVRAEADLSTGPHTRQQGRNVTQRVAGLIVVVLAILPLVAFLVSRSESSPPAQTPDSELTAGLTLPATVGPMELPAAEKQAPLPQPPAIDLDARSVRKPSKPVAARVPVTPSKPKPIPPREDSKVETKEPKKPPLPDVQPEVSTQPEVADVSAPAAPSEPSVLSIPESLRIRLTHPISSDRPSETVLAAVVEPAEFAGATVEGVVVDSKSSGRPRSQSNLELRINDLNYDRQVLALACRITGVRNSRGEADRDDGGHALKTKESWVNRRKDSAEKIGSAVVGLFGIGRRKNKGASTTKLTAKAPRITLAAGSEFDLHVVPEDQ